MSLLNEGMPAGEDTPAQRSYADQEMIDHVQGEASAPRPGVYAPPRTTQETGAGGFTNMSDASQSRSNMGQSPLEVSGLLSSRHFGPGPSSAPGVPAEHAPADQSQEFQELMHSAESGLGHGAQEGGQQSNEGRPSPGFARPSFAATPPEAGKPVPASPRVPLPSNAKVDSQLRSGQGAVISYGQPNHPYEN